MHKKSITILSGIFLAFLLVAAFFMVIFSHESANIKSVENRHIETERKKIPLEKKKRSKYKTNIRKSPKGIYRDFSDLRKESPMPPLDELAKIAVMQKINDPYFNNEAPLAYDDIIENQLVDEEWTQTRRDAFEALLVDEQYDDISLRQLKCYALLCKYEIEYPDKDTIIDLAQDLGENRVLLGPGHIFTHKKDDGTYKADIYYGRYGEDHILNKTLTEKLYENITGNSSDSVVPTKQEMAKVMAYYDSLVVAD